MQVYVPAWAAWTDPILNIAPLPPRSNTAIPEWGDIAWLFSVHRSFKGASPSITAQGTVTTWPEFSGSSPNENGNSFGITVIIKKSRQTERDRDSLWFGAFAVDYHTACHTAVNEWLLFFGSGNDVEWFNEIIRWSGTWGNGQVFYYFLCTTAKSKPRWIMKQLCVNNPNKCINDMGVDLVNRKEASRKEFYVIMFVYR